MFTIYPAIFYEEDDGRYSVIFPDLNHLATCGDDMQEAMEMAIDCLAGYIRSEEEDGNILPPPSPLSAIDEKTVAAAIDYDEYKAAYVNLVPVDVEAYAREHFDREIERIVTLPLWLDETAKARNLNFSKILRDALKAEIEKPPQLTSE